MRKIRVFPCLTRSLAAVAALAVLGAFAPGAAAQGPDGLTVFQAWSGQVGVSVDGWGHSDILGTQTGPIGGGDVIEGGPGTGIPGIRFAIPENASILAAYLYTATEQALPTPGSVTVGDPTNPSHTIGDADWDRTYFNAKRNGQGDPTLNEVFFHMGREDVTGMVNDAIAAAAVAAPWVTKSSAAGVDTYELFIAEPDAPRCSVPGFNIPDCEFLGLFDPNFFVINDSHSGEVLVVVYEEAALPLNTVVLLDGGADPEGDDVTVNFSSLPFHSESPVTGSIDIDASAGATLSLGISYGADDTAQASEIGVGTSPGTAQLLTMLAGGNNDNVDRGVVDFSTDPASSTDEQSVGLANGEGGVGQGNLITAGGVGDTMLICSPLSIVPCVGDLKATNPELYEISSYFTAADSTIAITNDNSTSLDDNLFMAVLTARTQLGNGQPPLLSAPSTLLCVSLGTGLVLLLSGRRRRPAPAA